MAQSDRSPRDPPRKGAAPKPAPRPTGGRSPPSPRARPTTGGAPARRAPARPPARAPARASARAPARARPAPTPPAASAATRLKRGGKPVVAKTAETPGEGPVIHRTPAWRRLWDWLLEDPSKAQQRGPTEREKALQKVAERDRELRRQLVRSTFRRKRGAATVEGIAYVGPAQWPRAPRPAMRPTTPDATSTAKSTPKAAKAKPIGWLRGAKRPETQKADERSPGARPGRQPDAHDDASPAKPFPVVTLWHLLLGERRRVDDQGDKVIVPPSETDWRWNLHRFFRSNVRALVYARSLLLLVLVLSSAWVSLYATTGFDYTDLVFGGDSDDPRDAYKLPFFVIESGSMMHPDAPWGRVGTIDPGDLVVIEKYSDDMKIETFYGAGDRHVAGAKGDVIMYLPVECRGCDPPRPTIHRAVAYIERDVLQVPNPETGPNQPRFVASPRFTVEEFGIVSANAVTIPELGLINYQPDRGGYITRGDNPRSNNWADQALGVTPFPVPEERIIGRMKAEVPVVGLAKIALTGQVPGSLSVDEQWCDFLAGTAACDTWVLFFLVAIVVVGVPLVVTTFIFGRRLWQRQLDRIAAKQAAAAAGADERRPQGEDGPTTLPVHDATDLLSGKVRVGPQAARSATHAWPPAPAGRVHEDGR